MHKIKFILLLLLTACCSLHYYAQSETDSLQILIDKAKEDSAKVNLYNELCWVIYIDNPLEAKKYAKLAIELSKKINYEAGLTNAYNKLGILEKETGNYTEALEYYRLSMELSVKLKDSLGICMLYNNIGNVYKSKGDYPAALENLFNALKINELLNRVEGQADGLLNIGLIYDDLNNTDLALKYLEQSLEIARKMSDNSKASRALMNIGNIYSDGKNDDKQKALDYYNQALDISIETGEKRGQSMCLNNIGSVYFDMGQWQKAEEYYFKSLKIKEETGDRKGIAIINENLAYIEQEKKDYKKANDYFSKALAIIDSIGNLGIKISLLQSIADNYYLMKDYKSSAETHKILFQLNDSIFNSEMTNQLSEMQAKYETEKKDKEILVLQKNKEIQDKEIGRQKVVRNSIIGISGLILLLLIGSIIAFREKKKANIKLALQNEEIMQQKEEIETQRDLLSVRNEEILQHQEEIIAQRDEIETQRDTVTKQKEHIEEIHKEVTDSINYARRIQQAMLPDLSSKPQNSSLKLNDGDSDTEALEVSGTKKVFETWNPEMNSGKFLEFETFVLFRPKDVVSGDFYWSSKVNEYMIYAVADCTGHGVPGAFMSMLGISFLNEIVRKKEVTQASHVLDQLRISIIDALKQTGESGTQKDGMDISLIVIKSKAQSQKPKAQSVALSLSKCEELSHSPLEKGGRGIDNTYEVQWAGANNPLWIIKSPKFQEKKSKPQEIEVNSNSLDFEFEALFLELKGDKMPIAIYEKMENFTNHQLQLQTGDTIYLMSDGYQDQFGGTNNKKFLSKNLKQLLSSNCQLSMEEQKQNLENTLENWIGEGEQIDDITILGIRI